MLNPLALRLLQMLNQYDTHDELYVAAQLGLLGGDWEVLPIYGSLDFYALNANGSGRPCLGFVTRSQTCRFCQDDNTLGTLFKCPRDAFVHYSRQQERSYGRLVTPDRV